MQMEVLESSAQLGKRAAQRAAEILNHAISNQGYARLVLSTGASQFDTLDALAQLDVEWQKVEMFHLDEYVGLSDTHPASFRKYLRERFVERVPLKKGHFVVTEGDVRAQISELSAELRRAPIDLALIGIGENAHIAFNDPPADFNTHEAYIIVRLDDRCKLQQVGEGWFPDIDSVPNEAVSMSVYQILQSKVILSCVPYQVKADAVQRTLMSPLTNEIPATALKTHPDYTLFLDRESASLLPEEILRQYT